MTSSHTCRSAGPGWAEPELPPVRLLLLLLLLLLPLLLLLVLEGSEMPDASAISFLARNSTSSCKSNGQVSMRAFEQGQLITTSSCTLMLAPQMLQLFNTSHPETNWL
jgi:hypothetical protein